MITKYLLQEITDKVKIDDILPIVMERLKTPEMELYPDVLIHIKDPEEWKSLLMSTKYTYTNLKSLIDEIIDKSPYDIDERLIRARYSGGMFHITIPTTKQYGHLLHKYMKDLYYFYNLRYGYVILYSIGKIKPTIIQCIVGEFRIKSTKEDVVASIYAITDTKSWKILQDDEYELKHTPPFEINEKLKNYQFSVVKNLFYDFKTWYKKVSLVDDMRITLFDALLIGMPFIDKSNLQYLMVKKYFKKLP